MEEVEINMVCIKLGIHGFWQPRSLISQKKKVQVNTFSPLINYLSWAIQSRKTTIGNCPEDVYYPLEAQKADSVWALAQLSRSLNLVTGSRQSHVKEQSHTRPDAKDMARNVFRDRGHHCSVPFVLREKKYTQKQKTKKSRWFSMKLILPSTSTLGDT